MKIERAKLKKGASEVPQDCKVLIERLKSCSEADLYHELCSIRVWNWGKCELFHWIDVLDLFDGYLAEACGSDGNAWVLPCDLEENKHRRKLLLAILQFTALLIEHSFSRHLYNSMEYLTQLLSSSDMQTVLDVLNLLYVFSKRSNFITRLCAERRQYLLDRLTHLADNWGGKENGFGLAECCRPAPIASFPRSATTLHFEYHVEPASAKCRISHSAVVGTIHREQVHTLGPSAGHIMAQLLQAYPDVPENKRMLLFTHLRLAHCFASYDRRLQCVQARLQSLSILVYCSAIQDNLNSLLYNGLIEELVDVLELQLTDQSGSHDESLIEIKAAALRTLTAIIHLDGNPKLQAIITTTGATSYHGFLPSLVRSCIERLTAAGRQREAGGSQSPGMPNLAFATALFSFLYHLASYESGCEALVACGMVQSLLKVIEWPGCEPEHVTFVTRAVRVIDLITGLDMSAFQSNGGLAIFIRRLEQEVDICRLEQPNVILSGSDMEESGPSSAHSFEDSSSSLVATGSPKGPTGPGPSTSYSTNSNFNGNNQCYPQRAALLKSMLNFLKKVINDNSQNSESNRHMMDGSLPRSLQHIISNCEYYGASLFLLATDVVTVYVFQEPSLLSSLQDKGLTDVVLHALLVKEVPATREVLASLPNVFTALCLNTRGLEAFMECNPFEKILRVLVTPEYLGAMRRRRSSEPLGDTASNLGNSMDELMRHQPSLRAPAMAAIVNLLNELCAMGSDPKYVCLKVQGSKTSGSNGNGGSPGTEGGSDNKNTVIEVSSESDDDEDGEDRESPESRQSQTASGSASNDGVSGSKMQNPATKSSDTKTQVPLVDYILNVMKFVDAILSNNSTDDHCKEFIKQKAHVPLLKILSLPNLPLDFPVVPACVGVASVCKSNLTLAHEPQILSEGLAQLNEALQQLEPLYSAHNTALGSSVLLQELIDARGAEQSPQTTPLFYAMSATHAYVVMFVHVCRTGQVDTRKISVNQWGSATGLRVLKTLSQLYLSLVWESTVLLSLRSESAISSTASVARQQLANLMGNFDSGGDNNDEASSPMDIDQLPASEGRMLIRMQGAIKQIQPLLTGASRLGRALAELFGLLVKLCVGSPMRQRRNQQLTSSPATPSPAAKSIAMALTKLLAQGLSWQPPPENPEDPSPTKSCFTLYICSVGFTSPMLFDERKMPYHLMLHKFVSSGGLNAFFQAFEWAMKYWPGELDQAQQPQHKTGKRSDFADVAGEFLDAWLMLLEKLVNPKAVLETPHVLPKNPQPAAGTAAAATTTGFNFDPVQYLIHVHRRTFAACTMLWTRKPLKAYGDRMTESILAILCHLLKGESIIKEKLQQSQERAAARAAAIATAGAASADFRNEPAGVEGVPPPAAADAGHDNPLAAPLYSFGLPRSSTRANEIQQLVDMGFDRQRAGAALELSRNLEQAAELLLTDPEAHQPPARSSRFSAVGGSGAGSGPAASSSAAASAGSVQQPDFAQTSGSAGQSAGREEDPPQIESPAQTSQSSFGDDHEEMILENETPLDKASMDSFTNEQLLPGCMNLLQTLPETVFRVCDLLVVVVQRNGNEWRDFALQQLLGDIKARATQMLNSVADLTQSNNETSLRLAVIVHLVTLLFVEMRVACAQLLEQSEMVPLLCLLVEKYASNAPTVPASTASSEITSPKWLVSVLILLDLYEKAVVALNRRTPLLRLSHRQWKWFEERCGKWNAYSPANNQQIDEAYVNGLQRARFTAGRKKYMADFTAMIQVSEDSTHWRPIMVSWDKWDPQDSKPPGGTLPEQLEGLRPGQKELVIRSCVQLISTPVDAHTLQAILRLSLNLTRGHAEATLFAELGGIKSLLALDGSACAFPGFTSLVTLVVRHVMEDPKTLQAIMERVIQSMLLSGGSSQVAIKEMHYILRVLSPAACRNPDLFKEIAKNTLRISLIPTSKRSNDEDDDARFVSPFAVHRLRAVPTAGKSFPPSLPPVAKQVVAELLETLVTDVKNGDDSVPSQPLLPKSAICRLLAELVKSYPAVAKQIIEHRYHGTEPCSALAFIIDNLLPTPSQPTSSAQQQGQAQQSSSSTSSSSTSQQQAQPQTSSQQQAQQQQAGTSTATQTAPTTVHHDKDAAALSRVLITTLAGCSHPSEVQNSLLYELRAAFQRALTLPESSEKHSRIQALTGLVGCIARVASTPSKAVPPSRLIHLLIKKGILGDLARVSHSLDLSSPHLAATINSALRPLELLTNPVSLQNSNPFKKSSKNRSFADVVAGRRDDDEGADDDQELEALRRNDEVGSAVVNGAGSVIPSIDNIMEMIFDNDINGTINAVDEIEEEEPPPRSHRPTRTIRVEEDDVEGVDDDSQMMHDDDHGVEPALQAEDDEEVVVEPVEPDEEEDDDEDSDSEVTADREDAAEDAAAGSAGGGSGAPAVSGAGQAAAGVAEEDEEEDDFDEEDDEDEDDDDEENPFGGSNNEVLHSTLLARMDRSVGMGRSAVNPFTESLLLQVNLEDMFPTHVFSDTDGVSRYLPNLMDCCDLPDGLSVIPPAPGAVASSHPLLSRNNDTAGSSSGTQGQGASRNSRGRTLGVQSRMGASGGSRTTMSAAWQLLSGRANPPAILQRLFGPAQDHHMPIQISTSGSHYGHGSGGGSSSGHHVTTTPRVLFANTMLDAPEDWFVDLYDENVPGSSSQRNAAGGSGTVPAAHTRWIEESRVLDGDSLHDCVALLKPEIISHLEKLRDEELAQRREKRKERAKNAQDKKESEAATDDNDKLQQAQLEQLSTASLADSATAIQSSSSTSNNSDNRQSSGGGSSRHAEDFQDMDMTIVVERTQAHEEFARGFLEGLIAVDSSSVGMSSDAESGRADQSAAASGESPGRAPSGWIQDDQAAQGEPTPMDTASPPSRRSAERTEAQPQHSSRSSSDESSPLMESQAGANLNVQSDVPMISPESAVNQEDLPSHLDLAGSSITEQQSQSIPAAASATAQEQQQQSSSDARASGSNEYSAILGDIEVPEGVDPSFLAALPESMRQEVIQDHLRMQRLRQQNQTSSSSAAAAPASGSSSFTEVNPEFLAALPPNIQEEVLAQQRAEQQRLASQNQAPDEPADASAFFLTLPAGLRQTILQDLDDSLLPILPPDLAQEAQTLRAQALQQREILQDRLFSSGGTSTLSRILRTAVNRMGSGGVTRYTIHNLPLRPSGRGGSSAWAWNAIGGSHMVRHRNVSRQLIDFEALSCLLVLLFVDEPRLNTNRLQKVLRNLAYNEATRLWLVRALLSMIEKATPASPDDSIDHLTYFNKKTAASWLSISLDAALGCKTNIFHIYNGQVLIHPQAANMVCRHALDTLISLGKAFPKHFMPSTRHQQQSQQKDQAQQDGKNSKPTDFWSLIVRLEQQSHGKAKGKQLSTPIKLQSGSSSSKKDDDSEEAQEQGPSRDPRESVNSVMKIVIESMTGAQFKASPLFQLILLLAHPVIQNSQLLTDRLLRLLALVVIAVEDRPNTITPSQRTAQQAAGNDASTANKNGEQPTSATGAPSSSKQDASATTSETENRAAGASTTADADREETEQILESHLKLAVNTLTSKSCSESGLEDATALLLKLSKGSSLVRKVVLKLLLDGARQLGQTVCEHISQLENELRGLSETADDKPGPSGTAIKGVIQDRFTSGAVVITAPKSRVSSQAGGKLAAGASSRELQLASMAALTSKTSNQAFLLRVLKVIIQLRNCAQNSTGAIADPSAADKSQPTPLCSLSHELALDALWNKLSDCLTELADAPDQHAVLVLQPAVEAFFLVHAASFRNSPAGSTAAGGSSLPASAAGAGASGSAAGAAGSNDRGSLQAERPSFGDQANQSAGAAEPMMMEPSELVLEMPPVSPPDVAIRRAGADDDDAAGGSSDDSNADMGKFLNFAETHRMVLNQILRQSTVHLPDGPFAVLVDHTRILDFDVKRKYFRTELEKTDVSGRREDVAIHVKRELVFEDSYRELHRRPPEDWKNRLYIVFEGEEGQDAGGLLREWYTIVSREIFNPMYALFTTSPGDRVTYMINPSSHCNSNHLSYFKFVGRVIAKAIYDNKLLECYFTRSFYKHILGRPVKYIDMESEDYDFYKGLVFLLEHKVEELGYDLTFSLEVQEFGANSIKDLKQNGRHIVVTEETKHEYVRLVCQEKMTGAIRPQLNAFLEGFYEIIPKQLISIFNEQELELLISGLPNIDIDDLKQNTEYHKYQSNSLQIQWFWRALRSLEQADRAKFLQFVTGTSKVPLQGFSSLEGMNGVQKFQIHRDDRSTDRLPSAHTCFNQLDLPAYETYDKLKAMLLKAIRECSEGFGFA
ncbi:E3 ubiquitin-protein ligase HUWE1 [Galendromus occidentalis]|uniref:HECT-type E3 ubiquitin transferase n=1 Tax=Galendromus occidentalis TaxID=34638 RepID=A0AAJ7WHX9_9ACAR|nr:E3 ubiquitin-protein ligase HUWE1 [Galendromus occidentalis]